MRMLRQWGFLRSIRRPHEVVVSSLSVTRTPHSLRKPDRPVKRADNSHVAGDRCEYNATNAELRRKSEQHRPDPQRTFVSAIDFWEVILCCSQLLYD